MVDINDSGRVAPINREMLEEQAALYALGALEGQEKSSFEMLLELQDPEAVELFAEMQAVTIAICEEIEPLTPTAAIKRNLLDIVEPTANPEKPPSRKASSKKATVTPIQTANRWKQFSLAATAIAAMLIMALGYFIYQLQTEISQLRSQVAISGKLIERLEGDLAEGNRLLTIACAPGLGILAFNGFEGTPDGARGNVLFTPELGRALVVVSEMPQAAEGKDYQVWMLEGSQPIDAGLLKVNSEGQATLNIDTIPEDVLSAFAVTVEPKGGSPLPTGDMLFLATVN
ncbi:MAG: anti-sigma factor [Calditrichia bacterium]